MQRPQCPNKNSNKTQQTPESLYIEGCRFYTVHVPNAIIEQTSKHSDTFDAAAFIFAYGLEPAASEGPQECEPEYSKVDLTTCNSARDLRIVAMPNERAQLTSGGANP